MNYAYWEKYVYSSYSQLCVYSHSLDMSGLQSRNWYTHVKTYPASWAVSWMPIKQFLVPRNEPTTLAPLPAYTSVLHFTCARAAAEKRSNPLLMILNLDNVRRPLLHGPFKKWIPYLRPACAAALIRRCASSADPTLCIVNRSCKGEWGSRLSGMSQASTGFKNILPFWYVSVLRGCFCVQLTGVSHWVSIPNPTSESPRVMSQQGTVEVVSHMDWISWRWVQHVDWIQLHTLLAVSLKYVVFQTSRTWVLLLHVMQSQVCFTVEVCKNQTMSQDQTL